VSDESKSPQDAPEDDSHKEVEAAASSKDDAKAKEAAKEPKSADTKSADTKSADTKSADTKGDTASSKAKAPKAPATGSAKAKEQPTEFSRAAARWAAIALVFTFFFVVYTQHPYYLNNQFAPWRPVYRTMFIGWLVLGLPYAIAYLRKFPERKLWFTDSGLLYLLFGRALSLAAGPWTRLFLATVIPGLGTAFIVNATHPAFRESSTLYFYLTCGAVSAVSLVTVIGLKPAWWQARLSPTKARGPWHILKNRRITNLLRSLAVKAFFSPLMITFLSGHLNNVSNSWARHKGVPTFNFPAGTSISVWWHTVSERVPKLLPNGHDFSAFFSSASWNMANIRWGLDLSYDMIFIVDCGVATMGYLTESRFLGNKTKSAEPTGFGWLVAISCYPPFNNVLGTYLPLSGGPQHITSPEWHLVFKGLTVALFTIYAWATVAFGLKFSNLTNRGIITRGPYRFIRHPAYVTKCLAWWLEHIPNLTPQTALFLCGTCTVYALRAWTEERHLSRDPDYREYKKKVRWKAIPGIF
jgi:protein-S-isoprenylcysteine O-methyltransferase Ste14